jgi:hypothetical protein
MKDHTWVYQNTVAHTAMQYFGLTRETKKLIATITNKLCTPIVVNMVKLEYHHLKIHHNFLQDYLTTKEILYQDISYKRYDNITACLLSHQWVETLIEK